jgi:hypothetical protein
MRRLIAVAAVAALASCGSAPVPSGVSVHVDANPFRVTLLRDGKTVVSEDSGARLRFEVAPANDEYSLTRVLSSHGDRYRVGTTEPGRTATVIVRPTTTGAEVTVALHPAANVTEIYDAFDTTPSEHFLAEASTANRSTCAGRSCR